MESSEEKPESQLDQFAQEQEEQEEEQAAEPEPIPQAESIQASRARYRAQ